MAKTFKQISIASTDLINPYKFISMKPRSSNEVRCNTKKERHRLPIEDEGVKICAVDEIDEGPVVFVLLTLLSSHEVYED